MEIDILMANMGAGGRGNREAAAGEAAISVRRSEREAGESGEGLVRWSESEAQLIVGDGRECESSF